MKARIKRSGLLIASVLVAALVSTAGLFPVHPAQARAGQPGHPGRLAAWTGRGAGGLITARRASPVKHVVVIYLENHSFDNVLGFWCDDHPGRCPQGGMPASVTLSNGAVVTPSVDPDLVPPILHTVASQRAAINGGKMNGWQNIPDGSCSATPDRQGLSYACVSGYKPGKYVANLTKLASQFAISDNTFSMTDSESWAGHLDIVAANQDHFFGDNPTGGAGGRFPPPEGWGCDSGLVALWINSHNKKVKIPSCVPDHSLNRTRYPYGGAFKKTPAHYMPTIMDRLAAAGLSWRIYGAAAKSSLGYGIWDICPSFAECLDTGQHANLVPDARFLTDAKTGNLPSFSVVTPGGADFMNACHNHMSMTACDNWTGKLAAAVMNGPEWSSTVAFITFDDCGCFYDQVPPPLDPAGDQEGPRVPVIMVSPYARPGYTDTTATTFAGILAYTEHNFGLAPLGVNDADAYGFANAFNYSQPPLKPARMVNEPLPASSRHIRITRALRNDPT